MTPRVYVGAADAPPVAGAPFTLPEAAARHVAHALRMRRGEPLTLFTGAGGEWPSAIASLTRNAVVVVPQRHDAVERESARALTLVQAVIAADTMDFVVRKSVELGAARIVPVVTERSQATDNARLARRHAHWRQIAIAACEQCGRNRIPSLDEPVRWDAWLAAGLVSGLELDAAVLVDRSAATGLAAAHAAAPADIVVVGPEGGFTAAEIDAAVSRGARVAHLGTRVLRAETAALAALALTLLDGR